MNKVYIALIIALCVIVYLVWHLGPCDWFGWMSINDIPNRCG